MLKSKLLGATAAAEPVFIEDVFSTWLYTGTGAAQTITNGIDLAGEGGLVWIRDRGVANHGLFDTERGVNLALSSNQTIASTSVANSLTAFNSDGFSIGSNTSYVNNNGASIASWTFRKAPRFFECIQYTGDGTSGRAISHNLGVAPGCMIVKYTSGSTSFPDWWVYHRGFATPETSRIRLNATDAVTTGTGSWGNTNPTDSVFYVGAGGGVITNESGVTYVAYLFAHDPLGPSGDGSDGLIACGSYTGTGAAGNQITLGWEPQWLLVKNATTGGQNWEMFDNMRGVATGGIAAELFPNTSDDERAAFNIFNFNATGFETESTLDETNKSGDTYIYIAIRRGPMREPTVGTEVFDADTGTYSAAKLTTGFDTDLLWQRARASVSGNNLYDRMRGSLNILQTNSTSAETPNFANGVRFDQSEGVFVNDGANDIHYAFRRAPGFFDVVAYTGDGVAGRTVPHNLGVAPELMIVKQRNAIRLWNVYSSTLGADFFLRLDATNAASNLASPSYWNNTSPTDIEFSVSASSTTNAPGGTYIAYLFATLPGVSKVGSYTGNGSNQTINCGFTGGARFVLIKRTDSTGDWYVWDTARGIVAGNDPHLSLNTTAAEVTTDDSIDPDSSGFIVNQLAATNINVSSASYIYLAIA